MQNVRIFFEKAGMAKYISHLDLMRCFSRSIKRAKIDIWYTEGFNPHPFMTFSLPLSLGTESFCESVDMRINDDMPFDEIKRRLDEALPVDIKITSVAEPVHKADEITYAVFEISLLCDTPNDIIDSIKERISADEILAEKKGKQGKKKVFKQVNIKENIKSYEISVLEDKILLNTVLTAGVKNNLNPSLLIDAITVDVNEKIECVDIIKRQMLLEDMTPFT